MQVGRDATSEAPLTGTIPRGTQSSVVALVALLTAPNLSRFFETDCTGPLTQGAGLR